MDQGGDRGAPAGWILLACLALLSVAAATSLQGIEDTPGHVVVGDLKLADDDEAPSDEVSRSFVASNLAPGDETGGTLTILREPFERAPKTVEPRLELAFRIDEPSPLSGSLLVERLVYAGEDHVARVEASCGAPLTLERLASCTNRSRHPLSALPDPTPEGRDLDVGVLVDPALEGGRQERSTGFSVVVTLKGTLPDAPIGSTPDPVGSQPVQASTQRPSCPTSQPLVPVVLDGAPARSVALEPAGAGSSDPGIARLLDTHLPVPCPVTTTGSVG